VVPILVCNSFNLGDIADFNLEFKVNKVSLVTPKSFTVLRVISVFPYSLRVFKYFGVTIASIASSDNSVLLLITFLIL
jgi:hypothetical protein